MENLKAMHIKRFVAHLLTFRHTVYYRIWSFCRPFRRTGREHHKTSDKPPPAGVGSRDGLLYVYHTADCSPLWCVVGCVVLYRTRRRPLVRCRSPPNVQDSQKFLNDLEDKTMRYRNNGQITDRGRTTNQIYRLLNPGSKTHSARLPEHAQPIQQQ